MVPVRQGRMEKNKARLSESKPKPRLSIATSAETGASLAKGEPLGSTTKMVEGTPDAT